jgi:hypothetical protein
VLNAPSQKCQSPLTLRSAGFDRTTIPRLPDRCQPDRQRPRQTKSLRESKRTSPGLCRLSEDGGVARGIPRPSLTGWQPRRVRSETRAMWVSPGGPRRGRCGHRGASQGCCCHGRLEPPDPGGAEDEGLDGPIPAGFTCGRNGPQGKRTSVPARRRGERLRETAAWVLLRRRSGDGTECPE